MLRTISAFASLGVITIALMLFGADTPAAALILAAALCIAALVSSLDRSSGASPGGVLLLALIGAWLLFGLFQPGWISSGAHEYAALAGAVAVWMTARAAGQSTRTAQWLWRATLGLGLVFASVAFISFLTDPSLLLWSEHPYGASNRLSAPFLSANTAATFYGLVAVMATAEILRALRSARPDASLIKQLETRIQASAFGLITALVSLTCVFLTASRAGATVCALAIAGLIIWHGLSRWRSGEARTLAGWIAPIVLVSILSAAFMLSGALYSDRLAATVFDENTDRAILLAAYWQALEMAPLFGNGPGGFEYINALIADARNASMIMNQGAAHNIVQQWLLQAGLAGTIVAAGIIAALMRLVVSGLWRRQQQLLYLKAVIMIAVMVFAHGMVDYALEIPAFMWLFAWVLGLGAGIASGGSRPQRLTGRPQTLVKISAGYALAIAAGLSLYAVEDRIKAQSVRAMDEVRFVSRIERDTFELPSGSAWLTEAYADRAFRLDSPNVQIAREALQRAIVKEPRSGALWMKLAYAEYLTGPGWTDSGIEAMRQSYLRLPYARVTLSERRMRADNLRDWRLAFIAVDWARLPEDVRVAARREARLLPTRQRRDWYEQIGESES
jgi:O-antigen ligase